MLPREEAGLPKGRLGSQPSSDLTCTAPWTAGCSEGHPVAPTPGGSDSGAGKSPPQGSVPEEVPPRAGWSWTGTGSLTLEVQGPPWGEGKGAPGPGADKTTAVHALGANMVPPCSDPLAPVETVRLDQARAHLRTPGASPWRVCLGKAPLTTGVRGWLCPLPTRKAVLRQMATALARQLEAELLKSLLVVGPHELVEACWRGCLGARVPRAAATIRTFAREQGQPCPPR